MTSFPSSVILVAGMGFCACVLAQQTGAAGGTTNAAAPTHPPAANPNSNPNPNPNSSPVTGQDNSTNPSANPPSPTTNGNMPINPQAPQTPPTVGTTTPPAPGSVNTTNGSGQVFSTLDRSQKGYLSAADVASNQYLAGHFKQCDSNGDGRLTQAETGQCLQQMPPGQQ